MLRLAILSARGRLGTFTGALVALFASAVLVMAGGMMLESALRAHPPVERYAATAAVVTGQQIVGTDRDVPLGERARVSSTLVARLSAVAGVRASEGWSLDSCSTEGHHCIRSSPIRAALRDSYAGARAARRCFGRKLVFGGRVCAPEAPQVCPMPAHR